MLSVYEREYQTEQDGYRGHNSRSLLDNISSVFRGIGVLFLFVADTCGRRNFVTPRPVPQRLKVRDRVWKRREEHTQGEALESYLTRRDK